MGEYVCLRCGNESSYEEIKRNRMKCMKCKTRGSDLWFKKRPPVSKTILAR